MVSKAAQELGKKGGMAKSEAKTAAARANAKKPRRKWLTVFHYGVTGADGIRYVGHVTFFSRFSLDLEKNGQRIYDYITEDLQWAKDTALPWKELTHFGGVEQPLP